MLKNFFFWEHVVIGVPEMCKSSLIGINDIKKSQLKDLITHFLHQKIEQTAFKK